jgi:hypothetical protein
MFRYIYLSIIIITFSCSGSKIQNTGHDYSSEEIQKIISQMKFSGYTELWDKVKSYEKHGQTKSALKVVKQIYQLAKKEQNGAQIIKALLYQSKYIMILEEDARLTIVRNFEKEIKENKPPVSNVLESYLAQLYWQYYRDNRGRFAHRTETASLIDTSDFRTWDLQTLINAVSLHFEKSLQNPELLQAFPLHKWQNIAEFDKKTLTYRPTLYDLLVHEALKFYQNDENAIIKPAYKFTIDQPVYLSDIDDFIQLSVKSNDKTSLQLKALKLYQDYLRFRLKSKNIDALAMADYERLMFVYDKAVFPEKNEIFIKTIDRFVKRYHLSDVSALMLYQKALILNNEGSKYVSEGDQKYRFKKKEALAVCESVVKSYPESTGAKRCLELAAEIKQKAVNIKLEKYIPENRPALFRINYKNISRLRLFVYKIESHSRYQSIEQEYDRLKKRKIIESLALVKKQDLQLTDPEDYQEHSTERILPELPNGEYFVMLKAEKDDQWGYTYVQVTDAALQHLSGNGNRFFVINRNNGKKIAAQITIKKHNYKTGWQVYKNVQTGTQGDFSLNKPPRDYSQYYFEITYDKNKKAYFKDYLSEAYREKIIRPHYKVFIFTDRSIYRPGQQIYFKSILLKQQKNQSEIVKKIPVTATLYDVNGQKISSLKLLSNEYGSVQGSFILPSQTLTGNFRLEIVSKEKMLRNSSFIRVEEYKRPKFEVRFQPVSGVFKVNDTVKLTGIAESFAGSRISNAKVVFRVKRQLQMPRWWYWYRPVFSSEAQEIAHGQIQTDEKGNFVIRFKALPDLSVPAENRPVFHYEVYAEVIDINGETHSATTEVNVAYHSLLANLSVSEQIDRQHPDTIRIETRNLNGQPIPTKGKVEIFKLQAPSRVLRKRPWQTPEFQEIDKNKFIQNFPHIAYNREEADYHNWKKGKLYLSAEFNTEKSDFIDWGDLMKWETGKYIAVLTTKDKEGNKIEEKSFFELTDIQNNKVPDFAYLAVIQNKKKLQPGDQLLFKIGSASKGNTIKVWVEKQHKIVLEKSFITDGTFKTVKVSVTDKDYGGFGLHYAINGYNYSVISGKIFQVPFPSKQLQVETLSFRDKLLPGQKEKWRFTIKGPEGEKIAAEVLASMYDVSLDQFVKHEWDFNPVNYMYYRPVYRITDAHSFELSAFSVGNLYKYIDFGKHFKLDSGLKWFSFHFGRSNYYISKSERKYIMEEAAVEMPVVVQSKATTSDMKLDLAVSNKTKPVEKNKKDIQVSPRKNLQETAFFFPQLYTDSDGNVAFEFTVPEALTKWKLQLLAHTPELEYAYKTLFTQTQKDLMVFPNAPRFIREGDQLVLSAKISNLTNRSLQGDAQLQLFDAITGKRIDDKLLSTESLQSFTVKAEGNTQVSWTLDIPDEINTIQYKVLAKAGNQTDGEQNMMPVLSNRMLVTETMPMWVRSNQTRSFTLEKLLKNDSQTLKNHRLTLEITSNPAWYAVQALPYLMEYPYDCSEQTFSRFYANALGSHIVEHNPKIKMVFSQWKNTDALLSALEKNQELKSIIIEETPWLRDAQSESEQKKRIALLFDLNQMSYELQQSVSKLQEMQLSDGGFTWFKGGRYSNRYITQHIIAGFGHLKRLNVNIYPSKTDRMIGRAINYLDKQIVKDYHDLKRYAKMNKDTEKYLAEYRPGSFQIHYLYMRSFFAGHKMNAETRKAADYYLQQAEKYWLHYTLYTQAMLALTSHRKGHRKVAKAIIRSLDENSITSPELGMYWKSNTAGYYWHQAPIETQALLIEAFDEIDGDINKLDEMRIWLLKNKQTNAWKTTKQTTEAIYALLLRGTDWLSLEKTVTVKVGDIKLEPSKMPEIKTEAGTGYFKKSWNTDEITPEMATVTLTKTGEGIAWGGLYWQYFEDLDKITHAETPLNITKELFIRRFTDTGEKLYKIDENTTLKTGDLVRVRIEIKVDRDMEYVHLKDMRAGGFEPVNVLSGYRWQDGLGYYESTRDASTNFFIDVLRKGVYVFEYDLRANNAGNFSNGITTIQCMYAPEFTAQSEGVRVKIIKTEN